MQSTEDGPAVPTIRVYRTWRDSDGDEVDGEGWPQEDIPIVPDDIDIAEGLTIVDLAATYIRERLYIWGQYATSCYPPPAVWSEHNWFETEPYSHPYEDRTEEVHAFLKGFTEADATEIMRRVIKDWNEK